MVPAAINMHTLTLSDTSLEAIKLSVLRSIHELEGREDEHSTNLRKRLNQAWQQIEWQAT